MGERVQKLTNIKQTAIMHKMHGEIYIDVQDGFK